MQGEVTFLDFLREAPAGEGRGNEELLRAVLPLLEQLQQVHEGGKVGPLDGVGRIFADEGRLWFHAADAVAPTLQRAELRRVEGGGSGGVEVVGGGRIDIDVDRGTSVVHDQREGEERITRPLFVPGYASWEQELGHHDALTDIFCAGMLLASLATGADFTEADELQRFVADRHRLTRRHPRLHPVIARAIVRMTEPDRHRRAQDLPSLVERLRHYRLVDERADTELDFEALEGFVSADRTSRRRIIQGHLQSRLFDISRRNRMIWFKATMQMLDLTVASVPTQLSVDTIAPGELFLWDGPAGRALCKGKSIRLDQFVRFEEAPWARGTLDRVRSEDRRARTEVGFSQLRLVIGFLNWHNLKEDAEQRIRSPLLLLPVSLTIKRGVRDSYQLTPLSEMAEVNPVLRHHLAEVYGLSLPEQVDLRKTDVSTFHEVLAASIARSEPGVTLHLLTRPQIRLMRETARRRMDAWRRRSRATGRGLRSTLGVEFSYARSNFQPLGLALYRAKVKPEEFQLEEHLKTAEPVLPTVPDGGGEGSDEAGDDNVRVTQRQVWVHDEAAAGPYDWAVDLTHCTLGNFNYRKMSLVRDYDRMLEESDGHEHPSFDTLFSVDARELASPPEPDADVLDLFHVVPADPTQAAAVRWARSGQSFIIQGPPGTGKSQTITNLIADFAAHGKRVLFVCQKRAALDVVYHRLSQHGLDELSVLIHDSQGDKKGFIGDLKRTYTDWSAPGGVASDEPVRDEIVQRLREPLTQLSRFADGMRGPVAGGELPLVEAVGERLRLGPGPALAAEAQEQLPSHQAWAHSRRAVHEAARALEEIGESPILAELPLRAVGAEILDAPRPVGALKEGLSELTRLLADVREASERVRPNATSVEMAEALALAQDLTFLLPERLSLLDAESGRSLQLAQLLAKHKAVRAELARARGLTTPWLDKLPSGDAATALVQSRRFDAMFVLFRWLSPAWWALRRVLLDRYPFAQHTVRPSWTAVLEQLTDEYAKAEALGALEDEARELFGFEGELSAFVEQLTAARDLSDRTELQRQLVRTWPSQPDAVQAVLAAQRTIDALRDAAGRVFDAGDALSYDVLAQQVRAAGDAADLLPEVHGSLRQLMQADPAVRDAVRTLPLTPAQWDAAVTEHAVARTLRDNRPLARFDAEVLTTRQRELNDAHHGLLALNGRVVRERVRNRFVERLRVSQLPHAELSSDEKVLKKAYNAGRRVLEREFEKVMRHRSIRELSEGDTGTVVYDLKPIWLMSPLSISDTIPLGEERFDVVIFDEASQIPLEEAVPAVYRAPQMIVVGDEMQLPPTSFFASSRTYDDADVDAEVAEVHYDLEADSFLSHSARRLAPTMLGWHYRSRHEALIRFSNQAFYDGRLLTVPDRLRSVERDPIEVASTEEGDAHAACVLDRPVSYHRLADSPYVRRGNQGEADYIAHLVRGLLRSGSGLTLGIVAFSEAQQGVIESALNRLAEADPVFRRELDAEIEREDDGQLVGLFVKNLENVQGDERDIIVLSVCYGPDPHGKMRMNFGPINKGGGEKRLNVVFSRAKRHMAVVASIDHTYVTNQYNDGALCLRRYLQYAEAASCGDDVTAATVMHALHRSEPASAADGTASPVVDELAAALEEEGLVVRRDLGASDFRVDLAVGRDDDEAMAVAVLVDTPRAYVDHDPFEAYHVRPSVLRAFGWAVVHVLSKDWLTQRDAIVARIVSALEEPAAFDLPEPTAPPSEPAPVEAEVESVDDGGLRIAGATIVFTGQLRGYGRAEVEEIVRSHGGRPAKAVSRRTTFVVTGKRPGSALDEAQARALPVLDEAAFVALLEAAEARS
ncbi:MAG: DUF4011 domain-containing protein [Myxococcales bacterium]|nr:DUF4011 domain-containing protein [Myxococcales bacterium]